MGAAYQYIFQNTASWWIDFTLDRLISERWILKLENWPFGVYVQAYLMGQYSSTTNLLEDAQVCLDLALVSQ